MKSLFLSVLAAVTLLGCKKNDESNPSSVAGLPDTSSSGKHFLACKVNSMPHIYTGHRSVLNDNGVDFSLHSDGILVHADNGKYNDEIYVALVLDRSFLLNANYYFTGETKSKAFYVDYSREGKPDFITDVNTGWVRFSRLDTDVVAGTFAFTAYLEGIKGRDSVVVTDGRFDISGN